MKTHENPNQWERGGGVVYLTLENLCVHKMHQVCEHILKPKSSDGLSNPPLTIINILRGMNTILVIVSVFIILNALICISNDKTKFES